MEVKQALSIVNQGIEIALGSGAFKKTRDVALLSEAIDSLASYIMKYEAEVGTNCEPEVQQLENNTDK